MMPVGSTLGKRPAGPLEVGTPFYQDGQLQVRIYWKNRGGTYHIIVACVGLGADPTVITTFCPSSGILHPASCIG